MGGRKEVSGGLMETSAVGTRGDWWYSIQGMLCAKGKKGPRVVGGNTVQEGGLCGAVGCVTRLGNRRRV